MEDDWDAMIFFWPCTHMAVSGAKHFAGKQLRQARDVACFKLLMECRIPRVMGENPIGRLSTLYRKPDQIVQPWQFGHPQCAMSSASAKTAPSDPRLSPSDETKWKDVAYGHGDDAQNLAAKLVDAEQEIQRLKVIETKLAEVEAARARIHESFHARVSGDDKCQCPYCTKDVDALSELCAEYELNAHYEKTRAASFESKLADAEQENRLLRERLRAALDDAPRALAEAEQEIARLKAELRGWRDGGSGQPADEHGCPVSDPYPSSALNFAWCLGRSAYLDSDVLKLMIGRADKASVESQLSEARQQIATSTGKKEP